MKKIIIKSYDKSILIEHTAKKNSLLKTLEYAAKNKVILWDADLKYENFSGGNLRNIRLQHADLKKTNFANADLQDSDFYNADLKLAIFFHANLKNANFSHADLKDADFYNANLENANFTNADLKYANLSNANLQNTNFKNADLKDASFQNTDLQNIKYYEPIFFDNIYYLLTLQKPIKMTGWKYLINGKSPYQGATYEVGRVYTFNDIDTNRNNHCSKGGNIATLNWCLKDNSKADEFLEVEFKTTDLIVPYLTDGKFRVSKFKVLRKINRKEALELIKI